MCSSYMFMHAHVPTCIGVHVWIYINAHLCLLQECIPACVYMHNQYILVCPWQHIYVPHVSTDFFMCAFTCVFVFIACMYLCARSPYSVGRVSIEWPGEYSSPRRVPRYWCGFFSCVQPGIVVDRLSVFMINWPLLHVNSWATTLCPEFEFIVKCTVGFRTRETKRCRIWLVSSCFQHKELFSLFTKCCCSEKALLHFYFFWSSFFV